MPDEDVFYDEHAVFPAADWQQMKERMERLGVDARNQYPPRFVYAMPMSPVLRVDTDHGWVEMPGVTSLAFETDLVGDRSFIRGGTPPWERLYWAAIWQVREDSARALRKIDSLLGYRAPKESTYTAGERILAGRMVGVGTDGYIYTFYGPRSGPGPAIGVAAGHAEPGEPITVITAPGGWH